MKKTINIIFLIILITAFILPSKVYSAVLDLDKYTSENLVDTFAKEGVTNPNLTKYNQPNSKRVNIYIFRKDGCVNCKNLYTYYLANKLLDSHGDKIKITTYEIGTNTINLELLSAAKTLLNEQAAFYSTPTIFIGNKTFSGDLASSDPSVPQKQAQIEQAIDNLYNSSNRYDILEELAGKKTFTDSSANITLISDTRLDKKYTLKATVVDNKNVVFGENYHYLTSYDISMYDENNIVVPLTSGSYKIRIPINANYDSYKVGYIKDGKIQEELNATYINNYIEFTTTHLSEYAIYGINHKKPDENSNVDKIENSNVSQDQSDESSQKIKATKENRNEPNPQTFDNLSLYIILLGLGIITSIGSCFILRKKEN